MLFKKKQAPVKTTETNEQIHQRRLAAQARYKKERDLTSGLLGICATVGLLLGMLIGQLVFQQIITGLIFGLLVGSLTGMIAGKIMVKKMK